jgi:hypothetical protein
MTPETEISILKERIEGMKGALTLQTSEYQRRLDLLNGEAERLRQMQETYLPRETYESKHELLDIKIQNVQKFQWIAVGIASVIGTFLGVVIEKVLQ